MARKLKRKVPRRAPRKKAKKVVRKKAVRRKVTKRKPVKRKAAKRKAVKRKVAKRKPARRKPAKRKPAKKKVVRRRATKHLVRGRNAVKRAVSSVTIRIPKKLQRGGEDIARNLKKVINTYLRILTKHIGYYENTKNWTNNTIDAMMRLGKEMEATQREYLRVAKQYIRKMTNY